MYLDGDPVNCISAHSNVCEYINVGSQRRLYWWHAATRLSVNFSHRRRQFSEMCLWAPSVPGILGGSGCSRQQRTTCELFVRHTANN